LPLIALMHSAQLRGHSDPDHDLFTLHVNRLHKWCQTHRCTLCNIFTQKSK